VQDLRGNGKEPFKVSLFFLPAQRLESDYLSPSPLLQIHPDQIRIEA
jgi:hypothetical protein